MKGRMKLSLTGIWVIVALSAILLPVFLPSGPRNQFFGNPIDVALGSMFVFSLPGSLVTIPVAAFFDAAGYYFGSSPIASAYLFIVVLFVLGVVQWFWLFPKIFRDRMAVQTLDLRDERINVSLPETNFPSLI